MKAPGAYGMFEFEPTKPCFSVSTHFGDLEIRRLRPFLRSSGTMEDVMSRARHPPGIPGCIPKNFWEIYQLIGKLFYNTGPTLFPRFVLHKNLRNCWMHHHHDSHDSFAAKVKQAVEAKTESLGSLWLDFLVHRSKVS